MTNVLAIVSLCFSVAHHLCRHFISTLRFIFYFRERMLSTIPFFFVRSLSLSLSHLSLYVLDDDALGSLFIPHFLVLEHSPFPSSRLYSLLVSSLSPSANGDSTHSESAHIDFLSCLLQVFAVLQIAGFNFSCRNAQWWISMKTASASLPQEYRM